MFFVPSVNLITSAAGGASGLLLDGISDVSGAWSFRRLLTAYAGNCCRIRRSSDNAEQDFGFVSDVVDTAGIATFIGGGSGFTVTWFDQSGAGIDVTQATTAFQPQFIASGINSLPTARFVRASSQFLVKSSATKPVNSNEGTFLIVQNQTGGSSANTSFSYETSTTPFQVLAAFLSVIYFDFGSSGAAGRINNSEPGGFPDNPHVVEGYRTTGDVQAIYVDGTSLVSAGSHNDAVSTNPGTFAIGALSNGGVSFGGDISELVLIKTDTGSTNRATIRKNGVGAGVSQGMGPYYGITVS